MFRRLTTRIGAPETPPPWGILAAFGAVIAAFVSLILGFTISSTLYCGQPGNADYCQAINFVLPGGVQLLGWTIGAALTIGFVWFTRRTLPERDALQLDSTTASLLFLLLIGVGLAVGLDVVTTRVTRSFLPVPELLSLYRRSIDVVTWVLVIVFMGLAQPVAEEVVFRGMVLPSLRASFGAWPGFLFNAALYGGFHFLLYPPAGQDFAGLWAGLIAPIIAGLIFGAVRIYTNSTRAAVTVHIAFGLFAVIKLITIGA
jgi:membrane protease YdiL (CAAX protease family)